MTACTGMVQIASDDPMLSILLLQQGLRLTQPSMFAMQQHPVAHPYSYPPPGPPAQPVGVASGSHPSHQLDGLHPASHPSSAAAPIPMTSLPHGMQPSHSSPHAFYPGSHPHPSAVGSLGCMPCRDPRIVSTVHGPAGIPAAAAAVRVYSNPSNPQVSNPHIGYPVHPPAGRGGPATTMSNGGVYVHVCDLGVHAPAPMAPCLPQPHGHAAAAPSSSQGLPMAPPAVRPSAGPGAMPHSVVPDGPAPPSLSHAAGPSDAASGAGVGAASGAASGTAAHATMPSPAPQVRRIYRTPKPTPCAWSWPVSLTKADGGIPRTTMQGNSKMHLHLASGCTSPLQMCILLFPGAGHEAWATDGQASRSWQAVVARCAVVPVQLPAEV